MSIIRLGGCFSVHKYGFSIHREVFEPKEGDRRCGRDRVRWREVSRPLMISFIGIRRRCRCYAIVGETLGLRLVIREFVLDLLDQSRCTGDV
jgi:hypothetical protein